MATAFVIPLSAQNQQLRIALGSVTYQLTLRWNSQPDAGWVMNIADDGGSPILSGVPLVTGCDLLAQYGYLGIEGQLTVQTDHDPDAAPTLDNLGVSSFLYYVSPQ